MSLFEETIDATLDAHGQLHLLQPPQLPPGPVRVTIRTAVPSALRSVADVLREIEAAQQARGFTARSPAELEATEAEDEAAQDARDRLLEGGRDRNAAGGN